MAKVGGTIGNTNSSQSNRLWGDTIRRAIAQGKPDRLRKIAESLLDKAAEGDMAAMRELGDRLDGKAQQALAITGELSVRKATELTDDELAAIVIAEDSGK